MDTVLGREARGLQAGCCSGGMCCIFSVACFCFVAKTKPRDPSSCHSMELAALDFRRGEQLSLLPPFRFFSRSF